MYGLCDCNNFFVSCERVFNPSLNGRAVIVLSNNDGCIIARSNEAKALGIKMGQPLFQVKEIVERNRVALYSSNYQLYGDMSHRVMMTLKSLVPAIEVYSIDEAFLNFDGFATDMLREQGMEIARMVRRNTGIPVSIGIAPTKTLAKIASKLCKIYPKLKGCCLMHRPQDVEKVLKTYPIEDVWGIGRRYSKMLKALEINTAYEFMQCPPEWVKNKMSVVGLRTWKELHGEPCIEFEHAVVDKQSISVSRSFAKELFQYDELQTSVATFTSMAAEKLRRQGSVAGQLTVFILTNRHNVLVPQSYESRLLKFGDPTSSSIDLVRYAVSALKTIYQQGLGYKKAGVILADISSSSKVQRTLFDTDDGSRHTKLMRVIDDINVRNGRSTVHIGAQGFTPIAANREHLSPRATTDWNEIINVTV